MEPITQGLLGAAVGQAGFSATLGRRALGWGALIGILPDLDILAAPLHDGFGELIYHRGSTHALWFGPVVGPLLGWCLWRWRDGAVERRGAWIWLCILALFTHPLLDVFTPYGTQFFAPFCRHRFAWNGIGIIDPFYTALLALAVAVGAPRFSPRRARIAAAAALALSSLYLGYGVFVNTTAGHALRSALAAEGIQGASVRVYPTLLQPWLRRFVARSPGEVRVGIYTPWPLGSRGTMRWERFTPPEPDRRSEDLLRTWEGRIFTHFAMDEITWRFLPRDDGDGVWLVLDDLRYGWPGDPPDRGIWGIQAPYDAHGQRTGPVERYAQRRSDRIAPLLRSIWRATWGHFPDSRAKPGPPGPGARRGKRRPSPPTAFKADRGEVGARSEGGARAKSNSPGKAAVSSPHSM